MKITDKAVLVALPLLALLGAFWFLVLSPKRDEAASLSDDVAELQASVDQAEQTAADAELARDSFPSDYHRLVVLGKAVPEDSDTSSLLVQLSRDATQTGVDFSSLTLVPGAGAAPVAPAPAPVDPATAAGDTAEPVASTDTAATPTQVTPTESAVASLPIGATVGPAGLPIMPYDLTFSGDFFDIADFIGRVNRQVGLRKDGTPTVLGRLVTVDGFSLKIPELTSTAVSDIPRLDAQFAVTTFLTPPDQGVTAGAGPTGPAAAIPQTVSTDSSAIPAPPVASAAGSIPTGGTP